MSQFNSIEQKLKQFSTKYYLNELIRGSILFITIGILYLFFTLFVEHFLWLKPSYRTLLFWGFIIVELLLLIRFICFPIFKIIGLKNGITNTEASKIIGQHFPEVKDKLLNILQLKESNQTSDLLIASIEQKSAQLQPVPFSNAIDFKTNSKYLKYAIIPIIIWLISLFTGFNSDLSNSFERMVNHQTAYNPPAPFSFFVESKNLNVVQGESITVYAQTNGNTIPSDVKINFNNQSYYMQSEATGLFSYTFSNVQQAINFNLSANNVNSTTYTVSLLKTPRIQNLQMQLNYPKYTGKKSETLKNASNMIVPQGTSILWELKTSETDTVSFNSNNKTKFFTKKNSNEFNYQKRILNDINYQISTSNSQLKNYDNLQFSVKTIKDEAPKIEVEANIDSIAKNAALFKGKVSDDYGISKLEIVYYDEKSPQITQTHTLPITRGNIQSFYYQFPDNLKLKEGINYEIHFQVSDNDQVNGSKKTQSKRFTFRNKTDNELQEERLNEQKDQINKLENSLKNQENNKKALEKLQFNLQNKKNLNWNDQKQLKNILKRQEQYKQMMQRQAQKLQENFTEKKENSEKLQEQKENLQERIEELKKLEKQQKLLDELNKLAEKLNREELVKKTKQLAEQNKQQERSLERVLELTKRFYVEQKTMQIAEKLKELAKKQEELAKKDANKQAQDEIKKEFDKLQKDLEDLKKDNQKLKEPMDIPAMEKLKKETKEELNKAEEKLKNQQNQDKKDAKEQNSEKNKDKNSENSQDENSTDENQEQGDKQQKQQQSKQNSAKQNQKKASQKMQKMSQQMQDSMQMMSMQNEEENMEGLRQVLENLVTFSFDQESLMEKYQKISADHPNFSKNLKKQHQLKTYFEHIDDSLFVLSMRIPKITATIQEHLSSAHYNLDQSLDNFANNRFHPGIANQQYVMTAANELADMLSNTLDAMQNPQSGKGKGKGKGKGDSFSLPDIIKKQGELMQQMQQQMQQGQKKGKKPGEKLGNKGKKQQNKPGQVQQGGEGEEQNSEQLFKIYQEQAKLRQQLEDALQKNGLKSGQGKPALKQMEDLENKLLENGFNRQNIEQMKRLNYELLKLKEAAFEQGKDKQRKSNTNFNEYDQNSAKKLEYKKLFYNQNEILNRQSLPLQQNYKKKVQEYFNTTKE